jgi:hypothetical protein
MDLFIPDQQLKMIFSFALVNRPDIVKDNTKSPSFSFLGDISYWVITAFNRLIDRRLGASGLIKSVNDL